MVQDLSNGKPFPGGVFERVTDDAALCGIIDQPTVAACETDKQDPIEALAHPASNQPADNWTSVLQRRQAHAFVRLLQLASITLPLQDLQQLVRQRDNTGRHVLDWLLLQGQVTANGAALPSTNGPVTAARAVLGSSSAGAAAGTCVDGSEGDRCPTTPLVMAGHVVELDDDHGSTARLDMIRDRQHSSACLLYTSPSPRDRG